uniref:Disease resistance N-terminal domain-containing protein n=1 Tax=Aegilops tauschii subsp. strangulata TaxID=200361 RepID=A0A452ZNM8_AEGTS
MDVLLSAVVSDLFGRSASFVINRYFQRQPGIDMILQRLERVVLRIDTVVEEAEGRHITNQGMLRQLKMLRQGMYRGHYVLDALTFQAPLKTPWLV